MRAIVAGADGAALPAGSDGELLMTGPQLTLGYWRDPERTRASFVHRDDDGGAVYYRTGDVVRQSAQDSTFVFLGRVDSQVKISGFRVEMAEVERALRQAAGTDEAVAVPWPVTESSATGIVAFVQAAEVDAAAIRRAMARTLPTYMVPRTVLAVAALPLNVNGKFDRNALVERLRAGG
jgi:acyl-coenzyme A synthetase/AMP-(fatty) acid ligase